MKSGRRKEILEHSVLCLCVDAQNVRTQCKVNIINKNLVPSAIILLPALFLICYTLSAAPREYGEVVVTEIVNVYDGDTFHVNINGWPDVCGKNIGVRILGIDTPEMHDKNPIVRARAIKAKVYARQLLEGAKEIKLVNLKRDKYFRLLANVSLDGHDFSKLMLDSGLAKAYDGGTKDEWTEDDIKKLEESEVKEKKVSAIQYGAEVIQYR